MKRQELAWCGTKSLPLPATLQIRPLVYFIWKIQDSSRFETAPHMLLTNIKFVIDPTMQPGNLKPCVDSYAACAARFPARVNSAMMRQLPRAVQVRRNRLALRFDAKDAVDVPRTSKLAAPAMANSAPGKEEREITKPQWEFPRLCRGGSKSLTYPAVDTVGPSTKLRIVSSQAHEEEFHRWMTMKV
jgi:hypothetical protein